MAALLPPHISSSKLESAIIAGQSNAEVVQNGLGWGVGGNRSLIVVVLGDFSGTQWLCQRQKTECRAWGIWRGLAWARGGLLEAEESFSSSHLPSCGQAARSLDHCFATMLDKERVLATSDKLGQESASVSKEQIIII